MKAAALSLFLLCSAQAASASKETVALVELFLKTPTGDLPIDKIPEFIGIDHKTLPKKLQKRFLTKREELLALKRVADGRKAPYFRRMGKDAAACGKPWDDPNAAFILKEAGYQEIQETDVAQLMRQTKCTECELEVEFTLKRALIEKKSGKGKPTGRVQYFLHARDPLMAILGALRAGKSPFGTNFFGTGNPSCR